jgi:hypothetical protein
MADQERAAQGLPEHVEDAEALRRLARLLAPRGRYGPHTGLRTHVRDDSEEEARAQ